MRKLYLIIDDDGVVQGELPFHEHEILERADIVDKDITPIPEGMMVIFGVTPKLVDGEWVECEVPVSAETINEAKQDLIAIIGETRRELQKVFTYNGHRQPYDVYDINMIKECSRVLENGAVPQLKWEYTNYDGTSGFDVVESVDYFNNMRDAWMLREQKLRAVRPAIVAEIIALVTMDDILNYDMKASMLTLIGE